MRRFQTFMAMLISTAVSIGQVSNGVPIQQSRRLPNAMLQTDPGQLPVPQDNVGIAGNANYRMQVASNEVSLIFHAVDKTGAPVTDLKATEIDLFDNERGPGQIVALRSLKERSLRVGYLVDRSGSVSGDVSKSRTVAMEAARMLIQHDGDSGIVIEFGRVRNIVQPWSSDLNALSVGFRRIGSKPDAVRDGTSLFDSVWSTCFYEFSRPTEDAQNVLLIFTDGLDTSSHATPEQAAGACQKSHVSIFVFTSTRGPSEITTGYRALMKLTEQTGGSLVYLEKTDAMTRHTVMALAEELKSEYQLFYRPRNLKRDGAFHHITLVGPSRVATIVGQSGYYALAQ